MSFCRLASGLLMLMATACQRSQSSTPGPDSVAVTPPVAPTTLVNPATPVTSVAPRANETATTNCSYRPLKKIAELQDPKVREASALVASSRYPGVYWTLNDSGNEPQVFAFDTSGRRVGTFRVENAENSDWESLQMGPGLNGEPALYIGDTGDNDLGRKESVVYRIPEPRAGLDLSKTTILRTDRAEAFHFSFPRGPVDVEAMLVHPVTGEAVFIAKENSTHPRLFRYPGAWDSSRRVMLEAIGDLDLELGGYKARSNLVTDASVSSDVRLAVVRTYTAAIEFQLPNGLPLAMLSTLKGHAFPLDDGPQGEGITYRADNKAIMTIGERTPAFFYQTEWGC